MDTLSSATPTLDHMHQEPFLKMEDIHAASASPEPSTVDTQSSPPPVVVQSKPAKKRKSWGQELPEPKTNLPPRKRAKTDDEKEQRRIERIKRNRAAAHNSRERKRQETETLAVALARANAELEAYRKLHGPLPSNIVLPEVQVDRSEEGCADLIGTTSTPVPSLVDSHGSQIDPGSPADSVFYSQSHPKIKQEPLDSLSEPVFSSPAFDNLESKSPLLNLDLTQHSAAMLCDLQCRSSLTSNNATWASLFLYLMATHLQATYRTILVALWTLSPSRMARMMQASTHLSSRSMTSSSTTRLLRSTPRRLALPRAATGLRVPQKGRACALTRQSFDEVSTPKTALTARQAPTHHDQSKMALSEHVLGTTTTTKATAEDQVMVDDGDENGVGRQELI